MQTTGYILTVLGVVNCFTRGLVRPVSLGAWASETETSIPREATDVPVCIKSLTPCAPTHFSENDPTYLHLARTNGLQNPKTSCWDVNQYKTQFCRARVSEKLRKTQMLQSDSPNSQSQDQLRRHCHNAKALRVLRTGTSGVLA